MSTLWMHGYYGGAQVLSRELEAVVPVVDDYIVEGGMLYRVRSRTWYLGDGLLVLNLAGGVVVLDEAEGEGR